MASRLPRALGLLQLLFQAAISDDALAAGQFDVSNLLQAKAKLHVDAVSLGDLANGESANEPASGAGGQDETPWVYVYDLPDQYRVQGLDHCPDVDCAFGGPPQHVDGPDGRPLELWGSRSFTFPWMLYNRLLKHPRRTYNVRQAQVFFVPVWSRQGSHGANTCTPTTELWDRLVKVNPLLAKEDSQAVRMRHILVDPRTEFVCGNIMYDSQLLRWFTRINLGVPNTYYFASKPPPFNWYGFPIPTVFHGLAADAPARRRARGKSRWLWSHVSGLHGKAHVLRQLLRDECHKSQTCAPPFPVLQEEGGDPSIKWRFDFVSMADVISHSTFCVQPPGDTELRKGIIDSIVFGCIPVLFTRRQLVLWLAHLTEEEMRSMSVFVPELNITGSQNASDYTFSCNRTAKQNNTICPQSVQPGLLEPILAAVSDEEVRAKQKAMAELAHKLTLQLTDTGESDALALLLERISADADAVALQASLYGHVGTGPDAALWVPTSPIAVEGDLDGAEEDAYYESYSKRALSAN